jgi:hypothetical protein
MFTLRGLNSEALIIATQAAEFLGIIQQEGGKTLL